MNIATAEHVEVRVDSACQIEERLNAAVQDLQPLAARARNGILVTRLNPGPDLQGKGIPARHHAGSPEPVD